jgi:hypothetical protein
MASVASRENCRHRERFYGVPGRKAMAENAVVRLKKSIVEWALRRYVGRPQSPAYGVDDAINNQAIRKSFSRKEGCLL